MIRKWIRRMIAEELEEELRTNALEYVDHDEIAESIDLQTLAGHVDTYDVAREMDACDVAEHVDIYDVVTELDIDAEKVAKHVLDNMDLNEFIENRGVVEIASLVYDMIHEKKEEEE